MILRERNPMILKEREREHLTVSARQEIEQYIAGIIEEQLQKSLFSTEIYLEKILSKRLLGERRK